MEVSEKQFWGREVIAIHRQRWSMRAKKGSKMSKIVPLYGSSPREHTKAVRLELRARVKLLACVVKAETFPVAQ